MRRMKSNKWMERMRKVGEKDLKELQLDEKDEE